MSELSEAFGAMGSTVNMDFTYRLELVEKYNIPIKHIVSMSELTGVVADDGFYYYIDNRSGDKYKVCIWSHEAGKINDDIKVHIPMLDNMSVRN